MWNELNEILIVDHDRVASILAEVFGECGYTVRTATDALDALAQIKKKIPDILIADLNMRRMRGVEFLSVVRRRFPSTIVVAMSNSYTGTIVPSDIAADGFYAKDSNSLSELFSLLFKIRDEETRHSLRVVKATSATESCAYA